MTIKATFRDGVTENEYTMEFENEGHCDRRMADMGYTAEGPWTNGGRLFERHDQLEQVAEVVGTKG